MNVCKLVSFILAFILVLISLFEFVFARVVIKEYELEKSSLYVIENPYSVLSSAGFVVKRGAAQENPQLYGITHLWEHLFFRNSIENKNLKDLLVDSQYNASTYNDYISFYATGDVYKILKYFVTAFRNPNFDKDSFNLEKQVVIAELSSKSYQDSPSFFKIYLNPTGGTIKTVNNISFEIMKDFTKSFNDQDLVFFVISNEEVKEVDKFNEIFGNRFVKKKEFVFNLERRTKEELYLNYLKFKVFLNNLLARGLEEKVDSKNLYLYYSSPDYSLEDLFFFDVLSKYFDLLRNEDRNFKIALKRKGIENMDSYFFPQKREILFLISFTKNADKKELINEIRELVYSKISSMDYGEFCKVYDNLYLDILKIFSDSWSLVQLVPYFIYNDNWELMNYYIRGCNKN
ncbi:MAG: M16 family metallopeptidase [bacterium]